VNFYSILVSSFEARFIVRTWLCAVAEVGICRGSVTADSKFLGLRAERRTVAPTGVHRIYTGPGLRRVTPYAQFVLLYYLH
jgi:hypothetical protein